MLGEGHLWRMLMFLIRDLEGMLIPDTMDDLILPRERYFESFVLISLSEVCQEWGVKNGRYMEYFEGS